ncbi:hypothetical protein [Oleidesulfovibrio sp.]|uniref:hypothetical protein n=1 Tax=Oleidesulfovibrio sp. TaxID=2909707 RepID=UPI003A8BD207
MTLIHSFNNRYVRHAATLLLALSLFYGLAGCKAGGASAHPEAVGSLDARSSAAFRLLSDENWSEACAEYDSVLADDPFYKPALLAKSLCELEASSTRSAQALFQRAESYCTGAEVSIRTQDAALCFRAVASMGEAGLLDAETVLVKTEAVFKNILQAGGIRSAAQFWRGEALLLAGRPVDARKAYEAALAGANRKLQREARQKLAIIDKLVSLVTTPVGMSLGGQKEITRAQAATLVVTELLSATGVHDSLALSGGEYAVPGVHSVPVADELPRDIGGQAAEANIMAVLPYRLRGLRPAAAGRFLPDAPFTRADLALLYEDCAIRMSGDPSLAVRYLDAGLEFSDVRRDDMIFNAVALAVKNELLPLRRKGCFDPASTVSGLEILEVLATLRNFGLNKSHSAR